MLYHHGSESYAEAASKAAAHAREQLEGLIERGRQRAAAVIEKVQSEVPHDQVVAGRALAFEGAPDGLRLRVNLAEIADETQGRLMHEHALQQACARARFDGGEGDDEGRGIQWAWAREALAKDWGRELLAHNLNTILSRTGRRYLLRGVGDQVRGFLSDRFRRLDSRPILDAFCRAADALGAVPVEGYTSETRVALKALLPRIFEPVPHEVMAFGVMFGNSDYGDGALSLRFFMLRLWCTNYAITDEALRQVHLGGRLPDDVRFSDRTYRLDTARSAAMVNDLMRSELGSDRINQACGLIERASEEQVAPRDVAAWLAKRVGKGEAKAVSEAFSSADVVNLPPGQTAWRLSNAISWVAGRQEDVRRKLELMQLAGEALPGGGKLHTRN